MGLGYLHVSVFYFTFILIMYLFWTWVEILCNVPEFVFILCDVCIDLILLGTM